MFVASLLKNEFELDVSFVWEAISFRKRMSAKLDNADSLLLSLRWR